MSIELATAWLDARGIDIELAAKMGWEAGKDRGGKIWLKIPYVRDGKVINHKYRCLAEKRFRNDPGAEHDLWNVDCLKDETLRDQPVIIAEGEIDSMTILQSGFPRTVSIPDGWVEGLENYSGQAKLEIFRMNEALLKGNRIIVAGDDDAPGWSFVRAVSNFFDEDEVSAVRWPSGVKDPNDCLMQHGAAELVQRINAAEAIDPPGGIIHGFSDIPLMPPRKVWKIDMPDFERSVAFRSREISILTGPPGVGKTTFLTWLMHHAVRANDIRAGMILMESDYEREVGKHLLTLHGVKWEEFRHADTFQTLDRNYRLVTVTETEDTAHGLRWLKRFIHKLAARDGCNLIVLDPWNEIDHVPEQGEAMTNYINFALKKLRQWATKYDIHILIVAHPRKLQNGERPTGYHVADSAGFFNKAGMGWSLTAESTEEHGEHMMLTTWKVRSRQETGCKPGKLRMMFDPEAMAYRKWRGFHADAGGAGTDDQSEIDL